MADLGESASVEDETRSQGSYTDGSSGSEEGDSNENSSNAESGDEAEEREKVKDEEEPVLKYSRFAKEVVSAINEGSSGDKNIICCIAVHPKVCSSCTLKCEGH